MQSNIKTRKTKKQVRKQKKQRGGSGAGASGRNSRSSRASSANNMPSAFYKLKDAAFADKFPPAPKYIPHFNITVRIEEVQELQKIFLGSPLLNKLIDSYKLMPDKYSNPKQIRKELLEANTVLARMIELLKEKYIYARSGNPEQALNADKWCDYIQKLIESNKKNITEINEYIA